MYLHVGSNKTLRTKNILGIFDCDSCTSAQDTKQFLKGAQNDNRLFSITDDVPRSFVVTSDGGVYMSLLSAAALKGRGEEKI